MTTFKVLALVDVLVTVLALALVYNALHRDQVSEQLMVRSIRALKASDETLRLVIEARAAEQEYLRSEAPEVAASLERTETAIVNTAAGLTALLREDGKSGEADRLQAQIADTRRALGSIVDQTRNEGAPVPGQSIRASTSLSMWALLSTTQDVAHVETEALRARMETNQASGRRLAGVALVMTAVGTALLTMFISGMLVLFRPGWSPRRSGVS